MNWTLIAEEMPGRTALDCYRVYIKKIKERLVFK